MNQRAANNDQKYRVSFSQAWNKFKKITSHKSHRTVSDISRYQVEKGYRKRCDMLCPLVANRESSDSNSKKEPFFDSVNQCVESENQPNKVTKVKK